MVLIINIPETVDSRRLVASVCREPNLARLCRSPTVDRRPNEPFFSLAFALGEEDMSPRCDRSATEIRSPVRTRCGWQSISRVQTHSKILTCWVNILVVVYLRPCFMVGPSEIDIRQSAFGPVVAHRATVVAENGNFLHLLDVAGVATVAAPYFFAGFFKVALRLAKRTLGLLTRS